MSKRAHEQARNLVRAVSALACVLFAAPPQAGWLTWDGSPEGTPPEVKVIESDADSTRFEVVIHGFFMEEVEAETDPAAACSGMKFSRIFLPRDSMTNYGTTTSNGAAELPVIRRYLAVLSDADAVRIAPNAYEIDEESVTTLEQVTVYPFQGFRSEEHPRLDFSFSDKFYTSAISYPIPYDSAPTLTFRIGLFHHLRVARVEMFPLVHIPSDRVLRVYRHFKVKVGHSGGERPEVPSSTPTYGKMYSTLIANYDVVKPLLEPPRTTRCGSYLIITPDKYYSNVMPLAWWKRAKGLTVAIRTIPSQIPNTPDGIKDAIRNFYAEHQTDDVFVLLVGDVEELASPVRQAYEWNELRPDCSSDIEYARVAGDDFFPDLFLGRIPADNAQEVDGIVKKILNYEKMSTGGDKTWLGKALLVAHKQDYPARYRACKESIRSYAYSYATPTFDTAYGADGATNTYLRSALNDGRGIVNYRGHGGADCWWAWGVGGQSWCITPDVSGLTNGARTPMIFSITSLNNRIKSTDCIGEIFVKLPQGGAVAFYGASADSGTIPNDYLDKNLFKAVLDEGIEPLGAAANWAQVRTMEELSGAGAFSAEYNANIYLLLGDPEMPVRTRPPLSFGVVEHPQWVEAAEQTVQVVVKDADGDPVPGALATVRKYKGTSASPDVEVQDYTDGDGKVNFAISPKTRGGLSVTVLKQDYIPYDSDSSLRVIHTERDLVSGSFSLSWQIEPGKSYAVYTSDSLWPEPNWSRLGITPEKEGLTMTFTDTTAGSARFRFYKVQAR